jgi:hypothetical protein
VRTLTTHGALPTMRNRAAARPAVLMFFDGVVETTSIDEQEERYRKWMASLPSTCKLAIIEAGAGVAIASIRSLTERVAAEFPHATVVRINVEHSGVLVECRLHSPVVHAASARGDRKSARTGCANCFLRREGGCVPNASTRGLLQEWASSLRPRTRHNHMKP